MPLDGGSQYTTDKNLAFGSTFDSHVLAGDSDHQKSFLPSVIPINNKKRTALEKTSFDRCIIQPFLIKRHSIKEATMFALMTKSEILDEPLEALEDFSNLFYILTKGGGNFLVNRGVCNRKPHLKLYGASKWIKSLLLDEIAFQVHQGSVDLAAILAAICGASSKLCDLVDKRRSWNPFVMSLLEFDSSNLAKIKWYDTYAGILAQDHNYLQAAGYYFCASKIDKGVDCLLKANCFRDAYAACRLRLGPDHELTCKVIETWISKLIEDRCFEQAACCYLARGMFSDCSEVLMMRECAKTAFIALKCSLLGKNRDFSLTIANRTIFWALMENRWNVAIDVVNECQEFYPWYFIIAVHQGLCYFLSDNSTCIDYHINVRSIPFEIRGIKARNLFLHKIWHFWANTYGLINDETILRRYITMIQSQVFNVKPTNWIMKLPDVAKLLTIGLLYVSFDEKEANHYWHEAAASVSVSSDVCKLISSIVNLSGKPGSWYATPCCLIDSVLNRQRFNPDVLNCWQAKYDVGFILSSILDRVELCYQS